MKKVLNVGMDLANFSLLCSIQLVLLNMLLLPNDKSRFHGWSLACCRCLHFYTQLSWQSIKRNSLIELGVKANLSSHQQNAAKTCKNHNHPSLRQNYIWYITVYQFIRLSVYLSIHPSNLSDPYLWDWNSWSLLRFRGFPASTIEAGWITGSGFHGAGNAANGKLCRVYAEAPRKADKNLWKIYKNIQNIKQVILKFVWKVSESACNSQLNVSLWSALFVSVCSAGAMHGRELLLPPVFCHAEVQCKKRTHCGACKENVHWFF